MKRGEGKENLKAPLTNFLSDALKTNQQTNKTNKTIYLFDTYLLVKMYIYLENGLLVHQEIYCI